jgi:Flp pilus assembly CpaE family ATPase
MHAAETSMFDHSSPGPRPSRPGAPASGSRPRAVAPSGPPARLEAYQQPDQQPRYEQYQPPHQHDPDGQYRRQQYQQEFFQQQQQPYQQQRYQQQPYQQQPHQQQPYQQQPQPYQQQHQVQHQPERYQQPQRPRRQRPMTEEKTSFHQVGQDRAFGGQVRISTMVHRVNQVAMGLAEQAAQAHRRQPPQQAPQREVEPAREGRVVVFLSGQGGSGCTTLACNVAATAALAGQKVCVVDLDLQLGDCLAVLNLKPQCPMSRLVADGQMFDWEMLETMLARHKSGALVLSQVGCLEELADLGPEKFPVLLERLRQRFDLVVVDGVRDFGDVSISALDLAQSIVVVTTQDVPAVRGVSRRLHILRRLGYALEKVQLVVNRHGRERAVPLHAIVEALGITPSFLVPDDPDVAERAMTEGLTLGEASAEASIAMEVEQLARALGELPLPAATAQRHGLWSRLMGKGKGKGKSPAGHRRTKTKRTMKPKKGKGKQR